MQAHLRFPSFHRVSVTALGGKLQSGNPRFARKDGADGSIARKRNKRSKALHHSNFPCIPVSTLPELRCLWPEAESFGVTKYDPRTREVSV